MLALVANADLRCGHNGRVGIAPSRQFARAKGRALIVRPDVEGRPIAVCMLDPTLKPCTATQRLQTGFSSLVFVAGIPLGLSTAKGLTDGMSGANVPYDVRAAGQDLVHVSA